MAGNEIVHLAIAPPDTCEANLIKKVAAVVNKDLYETRLLLAGEIPRIIAHYHNMQTAESIAQSLRDLGLVAIVCKDSELRKPSQSFSAHTLEFGEGEVLFWDKGGRARRMGSRDVLLILKGRMQPYVEAEATRTRMKFSLAATVVTGGIPIWRRVREKTRGLSFPAECFARLYDQKSSEPSVEILQYHIDYSFLEANVAPSSLANFNTVVTKLCEVFPQAVFDDRLMKPFGTDVPLTTAEDDLEINCKLIYLYHLAMRDSGPPA